MAVIFDLDGTIVDSRSGILAALDLTVEELAGRVLTTQERAEALGPPLAAVMERLLPQGEVARGVSRYREHYRESFTNGLRLYPGMQSCLNGLQKSGVWMGIATNKRQDFAELIVSHLGIRSYFALVLGTDTGPRSDKAAVLADVVLHAGPRKGATRLMVGDRAEDIYAAHQHGLMSVGVLWGYGSALELGEAKPSLVIRRVRELEGAIYRIAKS